MDKDNMILALREPFLFGRTQKRQAQNEAADKIEALEAENARLEREKAELNRSKQQNERMKAWFKERTGLDSGLLADHMKAIDQEKAKLVEALEEAQFDAMNAYKD